MVCQNIPRKPSGKMTQALALSGTVVLDRAHSKLESIFSSVAGQGQRLCQGAGQEMAKEAVIAWLR